METKQLVSGAIYVQMDLPQLKVQWNGFHQKEKFSLTVMIEHSSFQRYVDISGGRDLKYSLWMKKEGRLSNLLFNEISKSKFGDRQDNESNYD